MNWKKIAIVPFIIGTIAGLISGNISLGIITTGFALLIWGYRSGINFIILNTVFLVVLSGNINFELIFLYVVTLAYLIDQGIILKVIDRQIRYVILSVFSIITFPIWKFLLGDIPAQFLNEMNIAGQILLLTAFILSLRRGLLKIRQERGNSEETLQFLLVFFLGGIGITGNWILIIPLWIIGMVLLFYLDDIMEPVVSKQFLYTMLFSILFFLSYILLPLNLIFLSIFFIMIFYLYLRKEKVPVLEIIYLAVLLGILGSRLGLLI